jgi:tRNA G18 (ribose-2'-O)-methylase SpoU
VTRSRRDTTQVVLRVAVDDADDPRLADYVRLRDVELRRSLEAERGLFIAEGEKVVRRAVEAGCRPRSFLMAERWLEGLDDVLASAPTVPCYVVSEETAERVTGFHVHRGALASLNRPAPPTVDHVTNGARRIVVLEDLVDHANVGAAFRSAAALGVDGVLVTPRCADPLYRRAIKVSMGAVFNLPWTMIEPWPHAIGSLRTSGFSIAALTLAHDSISLDDFSTQSRHAKLVWVLGTEGHGVQARTAAAADARVRIPMDAGVDSLNVAAAAAVAFYATRL